MLISPGGGRLREMHGRNKARLFPFININRIKDMNKIFLTMALLVCTLVVTANAQSYKKTELGIKTTINSTEVEIQFYNPTTVRVLKSPEGKTYEKKSLSVIETTKKTAFSIKQIGDELSLKSKSVQVNLNMKNGKISFSTPTGVLLLSEKKAGAAFTDFNDAGVKTYSVSQSFVLNKDEAIYGLGILQKGKMVQRDHKVNMVQNNTEDFVPFFQSVKGYGVFWDNYSPTVFEDNPESTSFKSDVGDCIDYYFMTGGNADGVIACMRGLTGQVPMFPLWTYGYFQSKERYKSQDETVDIVKKYREIGVPLDGIIQDWQYWGNNYLWNAMEFLNPEFYNPQKMVDDVHNLNAHMLISIWNSFGPKTKQYKELDQIDALMDFQTWPQSGSQKWPPNMDYPSGVRVYDPYNPQARDIYWKYLNKGIFSLGMDGWWMDSSEPDHLNFKPSDLDNKTYLGSFRKVRNAFPLMTVGGVYTHQRSLTSDKRVFILTRSAFAGQQRYGANTWSGDVVASWDALRNQISAGLNFSLCGIPYWNSDIGGFFLWNFPKKLDDANYRELYTRWLQFGAFCPMMRSHGTDAPREIYQFGKKGNKIYDAIEKFINLRYRLLPYIYSTSWDVTANQSSMTRALVMDFADDKKALDINDQYLFGKSLLVCPVTRPMYSKDTKEDFSTVKTRQIYLPKDANWFDFWTGEKYSGGQILTKETPIDIMPLYVKAGSILPMGPKVQYATEKKWDDLEIRIYPGTDGEFVLYEDEFDNYNYEKGSYSTITFQWDDEKRTLTINDRKDSFPGMITDRTFNIVKVTPGVGTGMDAVKKYDKVVTYTGEKVIVRI
jgi:alpha-D-xyloside xylohydrolase